MKKERSRVSKVVARRYALRRSSPRTLRKLSFHSIRGGFTSAQ